MINESGNNNRALGPSHMVSHQIDNSESPPELLANLAKSNDEASRVAVALNPATPIAILEEVLNDKSSYVLNCLKKRGYETRPVFRKPKIIIGNNLVFRDATTNDAEFIVELRTDARKSAHISKTSNNIKLQEEWLEKYTNDCEQVYFVIQKINGERIGTVRLYDVQGDSFCWGSWILKEGVPSNFAIESALLVYHFALSLGFKNAHFNVRKGNESVWKFHERFGALKSGETADEYLYSISLEAIVRSLKKYKKYLPNGFNVKE